MTSIATPAEFPNFSTSPQAYTDKLQLSPSQLAQLPSTLHFRSNPKTQEPHLQLSRPLILTPSRLSDIPHRVKLLNDPTVSPFVYSPPNPYTTRDAEQRFVDMRRIESEEFEKSFEQGRAEGCPLSVIRLRRGDSVNASPSTSTLNPAELSEGGSTPITVNPVEANGSSQTEDQARDEGDDIFIGEFRVFREDSFLELPSGSARTTAINRNLSLPTGDGRIIYTWYFLLLPEFAGKGYMTTVLRELREGWLRPYLGVRTIEAQAFSDNVASRRVHRKLGFREVEEVPIMMPQDRGGMERMERVFRWDAFAVELEATNASAE